MALDKKRLNELQKKYNVELGSNSINLRSTDTELPKFFEEEYLLDCIQRFDYKFIDFAVEWLSGGELIRGDDSLKIRFEGVELPFEGLKEDMLFLLNVIRNSQLFDYTKMNPDISIDIYEFLDILPRNIYLAYDKPDVEYDESDWCSILAYTKNKALLK